MVLLEMSRIPSTKFCLVLLLVIEIIFFHKMFVGSVPLPFDHLVGALYPWADYRLGYQAGIPIKNPALSDVFATIYPWRSLAMDLIREGQLPLWNSYQFSGTPLMANLQTAAFYPLNILMLVFGNLWGYSLIVLLQPLLSSLWMFLYLRQIKLSQMSSLVGSIIFAYSGFMLTYLEMTTASQVFLWTPLLLFLLERYAVQKQILWLILFPVVEAIMLLAGNFQVAFHSLCLIFCYIIFLAFRYRSPVKRLWLGILLTGLLALGILLASFQILSSVELLNNSIRSSDLNIQQYHYGLIPLYNLITFLAPDFFGNPATYNFWGVVGYQETTFYFGVIAFVLFIASFLIRGSKFNSHQKFYLITFITSALFIFDTPLGLLVYQLKLPVLSTSYASRLILVLNFSAACLVALGFEKVTQLRKELKRFVGLNICLLLLVAIIIFGMTRSSTLDLSLISQLKVSLRNLVVPLGFLLIFGAALILKINKKILQLVIIILVIADLFRFGLKFTPFSKTDFAYPPTPTTSFLQQNLGSYRFEREQTEILPPNTWVQYRLQSASGYDPLYSKDYANFYSIVNGNLSQAVSTRYLELGNYNSPFLDLLGIKYMVVAKRDPQAVIDQEASSSASIFKQTRFNQVFSDRSMVVLENNQVLPRVKLFDQITIKENQTSALEELLGGFDFKDKVILEGSNSSSFAKSDSDQAEITGYQANQVTIQTKTNRPTILMLTDSYYPGWIAKINDNQTPILRADGAFRAINLPSGENTVSFSYQPTSFYLGLKISLISLVMMCLLFLGIIRLRLQERFFR